LTAETARRQTRAVTSLRLACLTLLLAACSREDPRFRTPETAVSTLLESYGISDVPEAAIRERLAGRGTFELRDERTFRETFRDHASPSDDGAAGYVLGRVAAAKDHLVYTASGEAVVISASGDPSPLAVLERGEDGYRFVLARSVPRAVRAQLREVYRRRSQELARRGARG
jgi:hypothetical protein